MSAHMPPRGYTRLVLVLGVLLACGHQPSPALSQSPPPAAPPAAQLDKLVAPIALYPDPLVAQVLPASTHPVEVIEAARALANGGRPDQATASQWDPSIQALLSFPTVLKMMSDKIDWTTKLGQAVAADQNAVMAAIQEVRRQARDAKNLESNDKQIVSVQGSGTTSTIIIEPANPQYIYVPQYNPVAVLAPVPVYYSYWAAPPPLITFGVGFAAGAATAYACHWGYYGGGYSSVTVNNSYHYSYNNTYNAYHPPYGSYGAYNPNTGSYGEYHPNTGTYTGYNAKTGTYGAYNPATGKYGTYNPSTGEYNKNGTTGYKSSSYSSWHPPASSSVGSASNAYRGTSYGTSTADSGYRGDLASGSQYHGTNTAAGSAAGSGYRGTSSSYGGGGSTTGRLGGESGLGSADRGFGGGYGGWGSGDRSGGGWGSADRGGSGGWGSGGDGFRGVDGGGWGARDASSRGWGSGGGGGGGWDRGGFGGGGFGGGFRGRR